MTPVTFEEFKKLPDCIQSTAIQYWMGELRYCLQSPSLYAFPIRLAAVYEKSVKPCFNKSPKKWHSKWHGQRYKNDREISNIEEGFPGSTYTLFHPIWQLLSLKQPLKLQLVEFAKQLPFDLQKKVLNNQRTSIKSNIRTSMQHSANMLDKVLALVLIELSSTEQGSTKSIFRNIEVLRVILVHFALYNANWQSGFATCRYLSKKFTVTPIARYTLTGSFCIVDDPTKQRAWEYKPMPSFVNQIKSDAQFIHCCYGYRAIADLALKQLSEVNTLAKLSVFMANLSNFHIPQLAYELNTYQEGKPQGKHTELERILSQLPS